MRKNVKSLAPALWLVIIAFIITIFAVWGGAGRLGQARTQNTIAIVNKEKISADFYYQNLRQRLEALRNQFQDINPNLIQQLNIPQQVLEQIIQQSILLQKAKELGIDASNEDISKEIKSYPAFQREGKFVGTEEYEKILKWNRISVSEFEDGIRKDIVINKVIKVLTAGIAITEEELWENFKIKNESVQMEYVVTESDKMELDEEPSTVEAQAYYEENKEKYTLPERRKASIVFLMTEDLKSEIELSDSEIEKYYEENESQFKDPEATQISRIYLPYEEQEKELIEAEGNNILEQIAGGQDFGELAKQHSKDEKADQGGDWGLYEWRSLSIQEQEEIERLSEGDHSGLIELEEGLSILKVTEKKPSRTRPLVEVKARIQDILKDQKAREQAEDRISQLEKSAKKQKSLTESAQTRGLEVIETGWLKDGDPIEDIDPSGSMSSTLFQLQEKDISSPIPTYKGIGIAQLEQIELPRPAQFEEVEKEAKQELTASLKKERAAETVRKIKQELNRQNLETVAKKYGIEYKTVNEHKRNQYLSIVGENSEIDELAFSLPLEESSDLIEYPGGYALMRVLDRKEVTPDDLEKEKETEKQSLLEAKRNKFFVSYMTKLREEYKVKIMYDLFLKISSDVLAQYEGDR